MSLLGIDVGTTGCKAVAFNPEGKMLVQAYREYPLLHPNSGWSELDIKNLWCSIEDSLCEVNNILTYDPVESLSVSSQGEAVIPIDCFGNALYNCIVSFDHRTLDQAKWWEQSFGAKNVFHITGMPLHAMYSINKIMWFRDNRPDIFTKTAKFVCIEDFVNFRLAGAYAIDWSLAGRTMAFDIINKCWSQTMLDKANILPNLLSKPVPAVTAIGTISKQMADKLGFQKNVIVAAGGHDQPCGALGAGVIKPGVAANAMGTVDVICPVLAEPVFSQKMLDCNYCCYSHVDPGRYISVAFNLTGCLLLRWYRDTFCKEEQTRAVLSNRSVYEIIIEEASSDIKDIFFLPHLTGAGTPYLDSNSRGVLAGLTIDTTKADISKAVLDSTNYEMKLNIDLMNKVGINITELRAIGGGAKSEKWLQMRANCFNIPISSVNVSEAASLGAAMLGGIASGRFKSVSEVVGAMVKPGKTFEPDMNKNKQYEEKFQYFQELYPSMKRFNHLITREFC